MLSRLSQQGYTGTTFTSSTLAETVGLVLPPPPPPMESVARWKSFGPGITYGPLLDSVVLSDRIMFGVLKVMGPQLNRILKTFSQVFWIG